MGGGARGVRNLLRGGPPSCATGYYYKKIGLKKDVMCRELGGILCPLWSSYLEKEIYIIYVVDSANLGQVAQVGCTLGNIIGN